LRKGNTKSRKAKRATDIYAKRTSCISLPRHHRSVEPTAPRCRSAPRPNCQPPADPLWCAPGREQPRSWQQVSTRQHPK